MQQGPLSVSFQSKLRLCSANHRPGYWSNLLLSESVGMCCPLDSPFSLQEHPLVGSSNVKHTPVGYHILVLSHSLWVLFVKFSNLATLLGSFLWKFNTPVGVKIHPADTPVGVQIHPADPSPLTVFEPLSLGIICEIFKFSHSFGVIFVKIWYSGWG